jgi:MarR family transcriptional regulator, lower aerobic nicotinate degradation pathway regulator
MAGSAGAPPDLAVTRAVDAIRRILRAVRRSARRAERELGLSGAQLFVLQQLSARPASSLNDLADRTHTHQSSVSVVVRRLVERGLVTRTRAAADSRRLELGLSGAGRALLRRSRPVAQVQLIRAIGGLRAARRREFAATLELIVRQMGLAASPADMMFREAEQPDAARGRTDRRTGRAPRAAAGSLLRAPL